MYSSTYYLVNDKMSQLQVRAAGRHQLRFPVPERAGGMSPSPDWFTGFYLFDRLHEYDRAFWQRFTLYTYQWNAGTDWGDNLHGRRSGLGSRGQPGADRRQQRLPDGAF